MLEQIAAKNAGKVVVGRYDVHKQNEKAREFNVSAVPTLVILVDGGEVKRFVGFTEEDAIEAALGGVAWALSKRGTGEGGKTP